MNLPTGSISQPLGFSFPTTQGDTAHGFYYPPCNNEYKAADNTLPPTIVICHGGPNGATTASFSLKVQFWTTRGFAVLDVNYRGSTGYGRDYRLRLNRHWGEFDVDDAVAAANYAVDQGWSDASKLIIRGSSAGGLTVLSALTFHSVFKAGCCLYGIGDLSALVADTHKFEARYLEQLVGRWPEESNIYQERSPLFSIDSLTTPTLFLQGMKDQVVPPNQAQTMVDALQKKGVAVALVTFENEGHGFRAQDSIEAAFASELTFYGRVLGFRVDAPTELRIHNLAEA